MRARNAGAAHATGDWLVFVDADSYRSEELYAGEEIDLFRRLKRMVRTDGRR